MKKFRFGIIILIILFGCSSSEEDVSLSSKTIMIEQVLDNNVTISRQFIIQTPNIIDKSKNYPIVFAFHGRGGNNKSWVNKLRNYTDSGEFVGVYPKGYLSSWNLGPEPSNADDVKFINLIVEELQNFTNLDFDKMYAIGTSNGSGMVNKLAIETNHFKAIAPVASQLTESLSIHETTNSVSVFQVNGAADETIPIEGGPRLGHIFLDAYESAELWATQFKCSDNPITTMSGNDTLYVFEDCNNEVEVRYLRIENGTHNLNLNLLFQDIWNFFQKF